MTIEYSNRVWQTPDLKGSKKLVMLALADHTDRNGDCHPGAPLLMEKTGLTDRQLRRIINDLAADGYISIEARAVGRGKRPHYRLFPCEEKRTFCPTTEEKADIFDNKSGHFVHRKADISCTNQSHARSEPITEPTTEPRERSPARVLRSRNRSEGAAGMIEFKSRHVDNGRFDLDTGYIVAGRGASAVEVYYERFDVAQKAARLNAIKEDDLVRHCKDLDRLREVIIAYSQTTYQPGNLRLILDWYRDGVPQNHRVANGSERSSNSALFLNYAAENGVTYGRT